MAIFKGAGVAIVTPMKEDLTINYDKLDEMLEEQIAEGTDAIRRICYYDRSRAQRSNPFHG